MRTLLFLVLTSLVTACASLPQHHGGQRFVQPGVSFVPPAGSQWSLITLSTYQTVLATKGKIANESLIVIAQVFEIPPMSSKNDFLSYVKEGRANEPITGRFEAIKNQEILYEQREETCVKHQAATKDFGEKRGGEYTIFETFGMNCIHPKNEKIGVFIEFSRKAPPETINEDFEQFGENLLKSVEFKDFR